MTKLFFKFRKPYFWPISPILGAKKIFSKYSRSVTYNFIKVSRIMLKFREIKQTAGWEDGQTLFHRILLAATGALTSTTTVDWHLKVKRYRVQCWSNKKLLHHTQHAKISSIHLLILKVQQTLGSCELK